ncbi:hypothetical protein D3C85_1161030 [compost metagenome]
MKQHEGIVVVAYLPGQPRSQVEADLQMHGFDEFTTAVIHEDGGAGMAAKVNLYDEAHDLATDVANAGFGCMICEQGIPSGWSVA